MRGMSLKVALPQRIHVENRSKELPPPKPTTTYYKLIQFTVLTSRFQLRLSVATSLKRSSTIC